MVAVPMGEKHMRRAVQRLGASFGGKHRIAVEPGVDQQDRLFDLDPEAGMAKPGDFHGGVSFFDYLRF
jgi:hypothetical protein